jgi:hypothetical protein
VVGVGVVGVVVVVVAGAVAVNEGTEKSESILRKVAEDASDIERIEIMHRAEMNMRGIQDTITITRVRIVLSLSSLLLPHHEKIVLVTENLRHMPTILTLAMRENFKLRVMYASVRLSHYNERGSS